MAGARHARLGQCTAAACVLLLHHAQHSSHVARQRAGCRHAVVLPRLRGVPVGGYVLQERARPARVPGPSSQQEAQPPRPALRRVALLPRRNG